MTPAEHLAEAERLLPDLMGHGAESLNALSEPSTQLAIAHALIAIAGELGVPHATALGGGAPGGN